MITLFNIGDLIGKYLTGIRKIYGKRSICIWLGVKALFIIPFILIAL